MLSSNILPLAVCISVLALKNSLYINAGRFNRKKLADMLKHTCCSRFSSMDRNASLVALPWMRCTSLLAATPNAFLLNCLNMLTYTTIKMTAPARRETAKNMSNTLEKSYIRLQKEKGTIKARQTIDPRNNCFFTWAKVTPERYIIGFATAIYLS